MYIIKWSKEKVWEKCKHLSVQVIIVLRATHNKRKGKKFWNPIKIGIILKNIPYENFSYFKN